MLGNTWVMSTSGPTLAPRTLQVAPLVYAGGWSVLPDPRVRRDQRRS